MSLHTHHSHNPSRLQIPQGLPTLYDDKLATLSIGIRRALPEPLPTAPAPLLDLPLHELKVRLAASSNDMAQVQKLRCEIDLAAAMAADPLFLEHEKKETN